MKIWARESKNILTLQSLRIRTSHREPVARGFRVVGRDPWLLKRTTQHHPISVLAGKVSARNALQSVRMSIQTTQGNARDFFARRHYGVQSIYPVIVCKLLSERVMDSTLSLDHVRVTRSHGSNVVKESIDPQTCCGFILQGQLSGLSPAMM